MIAVTIDDLPGQSDALSDLQELTDKLTNKLRANHVPAIGFVNEQQLYAVTGQVDARIALLQRWVDSGFELGNHTFSHPDLVKVGTAKLKMM